MPTDTGALGPLFIVMNAVSGHNDATEARAIMKRVFDGAGREHQFLLIEDPADLPRQAERAVALARREGGVVVAAGGDGTINGVARAAFGSGCSFGVMPQGTFNLFGRAHGIPQDTEAQARALLGARVERVQAGAVNGRLFLVNGSVGLYPKILEEREEYKRRFGRSRLVAVAAGVATLARQGMQLRLDVEAEGRAFSLRTPTLFVGNNRLQLERIGVNEAGDLDRGRLAAVVVRPIRTRTMFALALRGALGTLGNADYVEGFSFRKLTVRPYGYRRIKIATDGEIAWARTPLVFEVVPDALPLLVPSEEDRAAIA